jgi:hypothetical protein
VDRHIQWKEIRPPATTAILEHISFFVESESKIVYYSHTARAGYPKGKNDSRDRNKLNLVFDFSPPSTDKSAKDLDFIVSGENAYLFSQEYCKKYKTYKNKPQDFENFRFTISKVYEHLKIRIQFPAGLPPLEPKLEVFTTDKEEQRDPDEEIYLQNNWRYYPDRRRPMIFFSVDRPLPGYVYMLRWKLPETEFDLVPYQSRDYIRGVVQKIRASVHRKLPAELKQLERALERLAVNIIENPQQQIGIDIAVEQETVEEDSHELVTRLLILVSRQWDPRRSGWVDGPKNRPKSRLGEDIRGGSYLSKSFMAATSGNRNRVSEEESSVQWQFAYPVLYPPESGARLAVISMWSTDPNSILKRIIPEAGKKLPDLHAQAVIKIAEFAYDLGDALGTGLDPSLPALDHYPLYC